MHTYSCEMEQKAVQLAQAQLRAVPVSFDIIGRLDNNAAALKEIYATFIQSANAASVRSDAAECYLNNFYFIQEQAQKDRKILSKKLGKQELKLSGITAAGLAKLHDIALEIIACSDAQADTEVINSFISAYQQVQSLKLAELELMHVVMRTALIEHIRLIAAAGPYISLWNSIHSLRLLSVSDAYTFIEMHSVSGKILRNDSGGIYTAMDLFTRHQYLKAVETIALGSPLTEEEIAAFAIRLSKESGQHVGYYLVGPGRFAFENTAGVKHSFFEKWQHKYPVRLYLGAIACIGLMIAIPLLGALAKETTHFLPFILLSILLLPVINQLANTLVNWWVGISAVPALLPRMDFSREIPASAATMVVIPAKVNSAKEIHSLIQSLEIHYIGNRHAHLYFGLLTDFNDAACESLPEDANLLALLRQQIDQLNTKYNSRIFCLFHRPRRWNAAEGIWMGYERKRGKLNELNALLRTGNKDAFSLIIAEDAVLAQIKYVITLDADTQLPGDTAWKMIAAMAHPLNHPVYDNNKQRITAGYGLLQPRVAVDLVSSTRTEYACIHSSNPGIDPYARPVADLYQDMFGEGSFIGKGIYDVDAFYQLLDKKFPENLVLSHDLLEGCYLRSGLLSDVCVYEDFPGTHISDKKRLHRWIRGDWQIAAWLLPYVPGPGKKSYRNPLSALSRWKIYDNLSRSAQSVTLTLFLLLMWTFSAHALLWTLLLPLIILLPRVLSFIQALAVDPSSALSKLSDNAVHILHAFIWLPCETFVCADAIIRAVWRMKVSHRKLLEWDHSGNPGHRQHRSLAETYHLLWPVPFVCVLMFVVIGIYAPLNLLVAAPFLLAWIIGPALVWKTGRPLKSTKPALSEEQQQYLRACARKTWQFFETFTGPAQHWLPPDHYQEYPVERIATWTSPTNIGLALLANLSALDFGFITISNFITRTRGTLDAMQRLERQRGHFYNWYDIVTLQPAAPAYISAVDSGNLAGHLLTLRQGLLDMQHQPLFSISLFQSLDVPAEQQLLRQLLDKAMQPELLGWQQISTTITELSAFADTLDDAPWLTTFRHQLSALAAELQLCAPWLALPPAPDNLSWLLPAGKVENTKNTLLQLSAAMDAVSSIGEVSSAGREWLAKLQESLLSARRLLENRNSTFAALARQCLDFADMEYDFLYDEKQSLLSIGYNPEEDIRDAGHYDLLASEARLGIFVAIAQGKLPQKSWFALSRPLIQTNDSFALLSWSGTLFEYLMPRLVMPVYDHTLLDQTMKAVVKYQQEYGDKRGIPWGISECAHNIMCANQSYQYKPAGVPGLGVKRMPEHNYTVAPYAAALALMVDPAAACENLKRIGQDGGEGTYGFYEAVDYNPSLEAAAPVRLFMVHHLGMSLLSFADVLLDKPMQRRFNADREFSATLLLLKEKEAAEATVHIPAVYTDPSPATLSPAAGTLPDDVMPEMHFMSNGRYHVMVTKDGAGYSRWKDLTLTRWKENSAMLFSDGRARFSHTEDGLFTTTVIAISPDDDVEVRRTVMYNYSGQQRCIDVVSCATDNDTLQTLAYIPEKHAIIFSGKENDVYLLNVMKISGGTVTDVMDKTARCYQVTLAPNEHVTIEIFLGAAETGVACKQLIDKCQHPLYGEQICQQSVSRHAALLQEINITVAAVQVCNRLAERIIYASEALRVSPLELSGHIVTPSGFWKQDFMGMVPIVLVRVTQSADIRLVKQMVDAHRYWRVMGLKTDLVILHDDNSMYRQFSKDHIQEIITNGCGADIIKQAAGIHILTADSISLQEQLFLQSVACIVIESEKDIPENGVFQEKNPEPAFA